MGNWNDVHDEIVRETQRHQTALNSVIDTIRRKSIKALSDYTGRNVIAYYSGFMSKPKYEGIDIIDEDKNAFMNCIHGLDRAKGLDLLLHTPGGNIAATESLAHYLREMFGQNVRAVIPQIAMSAGTMLACACKTIVMGRQSNLGPIDPQINGIPADVVVSEFRRAFEEISEDPKKAHVWSPILNRYTPSFLTQCEYAIEWSKKFVTDCLKMNMFASKPEGSKISHAVVDKLSSAELNKTHSKHLHYQDCKNIGLKVELLEDDQSLQDKVLTVHHCFMFSTTNTPVIKIIENQDGRAVIRNVPQPTPAIFGLAGQPQVPTGG